MSGISFTLMVEPKSTQHGSRIGIGKSGKRIIFSDKKKSGYQFLVKSEAMRFRPVVPFAGPLIVDFVFIIPRPASLFRKKDPDGLIPCGKQPDRDNYQKGTQDALSKAGFWHNDGQIFDGRTSKFYAERIGSPRIIISIKEVES